MPLTPALVKQRQADFCESKPSLVCKVSSRTTRAIIQRNPLSKEAKGFSILIITWTGKTALQLRALAPLSRDPSLISSTNMVVHKHL